MLRSNRPPAVNVLPSRRVIAGPLLLACAVILSPISGCGGGSSGGSSNPPPQPGFTISLSATTLTLTVSGLQTLTITLNPQNSFSSTALCNYSSLPVGVNANLADFNVSSGHPAQMQFSLNNSAVSGTSNVTITCQSGVISAQAQFAIVVQVTPGIVLTAQPSSLSFYQGDQHTVGLAINGVGGASGNITGSVTGLPAGITVSQPTFNGMMNNQVTLIFTAAANATTSGSASIQVTNGTLTASLNIPITVISTPDFTLSTGIYTALAINQSSTSRFSVSATDHNGFNQPIAITFAGLPDGITFSPASFMLQPGVSQQVQVSANFTPPPNSTSTITVTGTGSGITHSSQFTLLVLQATLSIGVQPNPVNIPADSTALLEVGVQGTPNGVGTITVNAGTPPAGVTVSPATFTTSGIGGEADVFLEAGAGATSGTLTLTANYGPYSQSTKISITVGAGLGGASVPLSTSDQLVRTDALTPYSAFPYPTYLIYHAATNRFFSTDAYLNQLNVVDAKTRKLTSTIEIPGAFGLDQAPDGSVLYVGTMMGDLYVVDPVNLTILKRYPSSTISDFGFQANAVYALADGKLLLEQYFLVPGYSWVDGNGPLALWDPATNNITVFSNYPDGQIPTKPTCLEGFQTAILTSNRTRVLLAPVQTSEGSSVLCSFDPEADTWNWSSDLGNGAFATFAVSADGSVLAAYNGSTIFNLDPVTLAVRNSFTVPTVQYVLIYPTMFLSQDNSQVFLTANEGDMMYSYNLATGAQTGWIPQVNQPPQGSYTPAGPLYQAMSSSGLEAGVLEGDGIGLLDTTAVHAMPVGSHFSLTQLDIPYGPTDGGTATGWLPDGFGVPPPPLGSIYFGANPATALDNNDIDGILSAVTPAGNPGPADVRVFATDGGSQYLPDGFSYGPWTLEAATKYATADGGGPASLYGFGFGPQAYTLGNLPNSVPTDIQVTVGGIPGSVTSFNPNPYSLTSSYFSTVPVPSNALVYTVPPGTAGTTSDIAVSNTSGTSQAGSTITYLPATKQFPVQDILADGVYDAKRDVYYFTGANQVYVFSLADGAWRTPIPIPVPKGAYGPQRLYGIAISPDGSKLAIGDPGAIAIYIVDPDTPGSVQSYPYASLGGLCPQSFLPAGLAVTDSGDVYFASFNADGDGGGVYVLHSSTGTFAVVPLGGVTIGDTQVRVVLSNDNTRVYSNVEGIAGYYDTVSNQSVSASTADYDIGQGSDETVLGANQTSLFFNGFMADSNLNDLGWQALDTAELVDASYVYGAAFSADGSLFFQPGVQFIDVFDGRTGAFRARVSLPFQLSSNFRALVSNNHDSTLVAITGTGNGIAVIDLNSLPEPQALSYPLIAHARRALHVTRPVPSAASVEFATTPATSSALARYARRSAIHHVRSTLLDSVIRDRAAIVGTRVPAGRAP